MQTHALVDTQAWPSLDGELANDTVASLHLWTQMIGKTRLALSPPENHWWQVAMYLTARGLSSLAMPTASGTFDIELDLTGHRLCMRTSDGAAAVIPLRDWTLSAFYSEYRRQLARLGVAPKLFPYSVEMPERIGFETSARLCRYDAEWSERFFRALSHADRVLKRFRGQFTGKTSPVHFFWGGFDLAVTRFSGRRAPPHPGGIPNVGDWVMREAYSHEVSSAGFWPGDPRLPEPAFYAYAYPEPAGFKDASMRPRAARYEPALGEFVLPYRAVQTSADPDEVLLDFLQDTYSAAASLGRWDRGALERG